MNKRDNSVDILKGMLLIVITINHIGGPLCLITYQPLGFVSCAEGFVFLSGFIFGLVHHRKIQNGTPLTFAVTMKRASKIYKYHISVLLILLIPVVLNTEILAPWRFPELEKMVTDPGTFATAYALLLNRPLHLDILPMYVLFMPMGFLVVKAFIHNYRILAIVISVAIWFLSQLDVFPSIIPIKIRSDFGNFNFFSWQILFVAGCYVGYYRLQITTLISRSRWLLPTAVFLFLSLAYLRYFGSQFAGFSAILNGLAGRENLAIIRLLNFFVTAYLISEVIKAGYFPRSKVLALLGGHSLQVFAFQIILVYMYMPFIPQVNSQNVFLRVLPQLAAALLLFVPVLIQQGMEIRKPKPKLVVHKNGGGIKPKYVWQE